MKEHLTEYVPDFLFFSARWQPAQGVTKDGAPVLLPLLFVSIENRSRYPARFVKASILRHQRRLLGARLNELQPLPWYHRPPPTTYTVQKAFLAPGESFTAVPSHEDGLGGLNGACMSDNPYAEAWSIPSRLSVVLPSGQEVLQERCPPDFFSGLRSPFSDQRAQQMTRATYNPAQPGLYVFNECPSGPVDVKWPTTPAPTACASGAFLANSRK